jgi:hypothetical protein
MVALLGGGLPVGLEHELDQGLLDGQHLRELLRQLRRIHLVVATSGHDHLRLLLQREIHPLQLRVHVLLIHLHDLVVAHHPRVREVPDTRQVPLRHLDGDRKKLVQDRHAVGDVHDLLVPHNLGDEIARVLQVGGDGHADSQRADIVELLQQILHLHEDTHPLQSPRQPLPPHHRISIANEQPYSETKFAALLTMALVLE